MKVSRQTQDLPKGLLLYEIAMPLQISALSRFVSSVIASMPETRAIIFAIENEAAMAGGLESLSYAIETFKKNGITSVIVSDSDKGRYADPFFAGKEMNTLRFQCVRDAVLFLRATESLPV